MQNSRLRVHDEVHMIKETIDKFLSIIRNLNKVLYYMCYLKFNIQTVYLFSNRELLLSYSQKINVIVYGWGKNN